VPTSRCGSSKSELAAGGQPPHERLVAQLSNRARKSRPSSCPRLPVIRGDRSLAAHCRRPSQVGGDYYETCIPTHPSKHFGRRAGQPRPWAWWSDWAMCLGGLCPAGLLNDAVCAALPCWAECSGRSCRPHRSPPPYLNGAGPGRPGPFRIGFVNAVHSDFDTHPGAANIILDEFHTAMRAPQSPLICRRDGLPGSKPLRMRPRPADRPASSKRTRLPARWCSNPEMSPLSYTPMGSVEGRRPGPGSAFDESG